MSSSDSEEENVIRYGTPLEPYEEDEIPTKRKYQQPTDQYAVDAHGRRRFHGAFMGGFSAGFGNTVGSQEGWEPATFKSSRGEKAKAASQRPEDFMDEEDRSEFGIAPRHMQTQSEFSGQKRSRKTFHDGPIPGEPVLDHLIRAVHETAAVRMLRAMGWREGQGTGDRLTSREKKKTKDQQKVYGCYIPPEFKQNTVEDEDHDTSDSEFEYDTLFAPDDYEPYILHRKSDRFGLGYKGLSRHSVLGHMSGEYGSEGSSSRLVMKEKGKKLSIRGQAFGVGAFETDDADIYGTEDMSHYDYAIGGPPPETQKKKVNKEMSNNVLQGFVRAAKPLPPVPAHPPPALPRDYTPAAAGARRTRFGPTDAAPRDQGLGRHELTAEARGALLGEAPPPKTIDTNIPKGSTAQDLIAKITGRNVNFISSSSSNPNIDTSEGDRNIDVISKRDNNINQIDLTQNFTNTSDFISLKSSEKELTDFVLKRDSNINLSLSKQIDMTQNTSVTPDFISIKDSGKELINVFKPFASNPAKQARYEQYCANKGVLERDGDADRLSEWEREREMMEFEQAAKLYKPLTGIMGDRFTHASQPDDGATNALCAVAKSTTNYGLATPEQIAAAEKGVYGVMTRKQTSWRPESIVCKRFNVPEPGVARLEPKKDDKPKISYSIFSYLESSVHDKDSFAKEQTKFSGSKSTRDITKPDQNDQQKVDHNKTVHKTSNQIIDQSQPEERQENPYKRMTVAELFLKESEKTKEKGQEVTETIDRFDKMDLYKSIFLSDSEEESNENEPSNLNEKTVDDFIETPKNVLRNTSPPRGIFANIDFDELNSWRRNDDDKKSKNTDSKELDKVTPAEKSKESNNDKSKPESMEIDEVYGPKIPENLQKRLESTSKQDSRNEVHEINSSSSDSWVDAKEVKDKKKKKKSKHKKHKHKKAKHKKKDR